MFLGHTLARICADIYRDNDIDGILELTFAVDDEKFGEHRTIDLIPGGRDVPVTNENKGKYVEYVGRAKCDLG